MELRRLFDYLRETKIVGSRVASANDSAQGDQVAITVVDADDLLDKPHEMIESFCKEVGINFTPEMLSWEGETAQQQAANAFEKWNGFHNDAIGSSSLKPRTTAQVCLSLILVFTLIYSY